MRYLKASARFSLLALSLNLLALRPAAADTIAPAAGATNASRPFLIGPGADDGKVAYWTARMLEESHYTHHPFDEEISSELLDRYMELLDPQRMHFLQSDIAGFERYRTNLGNLTINTRHAADTRPAYEIFLRYYERLQQRVALADDLLKNEKFTFDADEHIAVDRRDAPYPKDLAEAKALWRQRLRYDYLQEKLGLDAKKAKLVATNAADKVETKTTEQQIVETLTHRYHRTVRMFSDFDHEDVMGFYLTALARVYDPHSDYFNPAQLESFRISMNLQLFGIGAELRSDDEGYCRIERLLPGPALKSKKITAGDRIIAVAQSNQPPVDVVDMNLTKVVQMIRGPKGTEVRLTIMPDGAKSSERPVISLIRDQIALEDQAAKSKIIEVPDADGHSIRLGVIDLPSFYAPMEPEGGKKRTELASAAKGEPPGHYTSADVARLLTKFKEENVSGVILDLRGNGGGVLEEAIKLTGLFIKEGPVVQARELDGSVQVYRDRDPSVVYDGPLIVLTSRFSASASEIVAAALQDYGRALIVGDSSTHGKGTVQAVSYLSALPPFADPDPDKYGALKFTIRKFYRPTGTTTQLKGVLPDIVLPSKWNYSKDVGESALENPLAADTIRGAGFDKLDLVQPYLPELLKRSIERVATNQDFTFVREDIDEFRKHQSDKSISMNEKERLREQTEAEARQKERERKLSARREPDEKIYEITLKQADLPGLPAPVQKTNSLAARIARGNQALGTNTVSVAIAAASPDDAEDLADADKPSMPDADMNEARRILLDYIRLFPPDRGVTVVPANKPAG